MLETCCGPEFVRGGWLLWLSVPGKSLGSSDAMERAPPFWVYFHYEKNGFLSINFISNSQKVEELSTAKWGNKCGIYKQWGIIQS